MKKWNEMTLEERDEYDDKNNYEHCVMAKLIIGSFAMHILILIYLIIKGV